jgi:hypothetical protein
MNQTRPQGGPPSIVGLTLAVNLGAGGGHPWRGTVNLAGGGLGGGRSSLTDASHPALKHLVEAAWADALTHIKKKSEQ